MKAAMVALSAARQFLRAHGWLSAVDPEFADAILDTGRLKSFARSETICEAGSLHGAMVGIVRGQVGIRWTWGSSDSELGHFGLPGSWWGGSPLCCRTPPT